MALEDEIKQTKPFKTEFQKLILNIQYTSNYFNAGFSTFLKSYKITPHQFNVLRILKGKYPGFYCNHEITERMLDKSSNVTRIVDKLLQKKLVSRSENPTDRRQVTIEITKAGLDFLTTIESADFSQAFLNKTFNEEKARLMNEWLDELRN